MKFGEAGQQMSSILEYLVASSLSRRMMESQENFTLDHMMGSFLDSPLKERLTNYTI